MEIKYRIISVNEAEHSFVVRYYTDALSEEYLAGRTDYNLTIYNVNATPMEIDGQIRYSAPTEWLKLQEGVINKGPTLALAHVLDKGNKEHAFVHAPLVVTPPTSRKDLTAEEVNELLKGLIPNDQS